MDILKNQQPNDAADVIEVVDPFYATKWTEIKKCFMSDDRFFEGNSILHILYIFTK